MTEIIEIMARADVDYFWREGGARFENFEKPVAAGVRSRMEAIVTALAGAGFEVRNAAQTGPQQPTKKTSAATNEAAPLCPPEDALLQEYADCCSAAFQELFQAARAREEVQFAMALNPEMRGMQDAGWSTARESMLAIDEYLAVIKGLPQDRMRVRTALSLYSHLSEASGFYEVPKNLLRIASGEDYNFWPFQHLVERHRASGAVIAPNANKIMKDLLGHAAELKFSHFQEVIFRPGYSERVCTRGLHYLGRRDSA